MELPEAAKSAFIYMTLRERASTDLLFIPFSATTWAFMSEILSDRLLTYVLRRMWL